MASGDTLLILTMQNGKPASTSGAAMDSRNDHAVADFDADADENWDFECFMPRHYDGGGLTITIVWMASTATSGNVIWNIQIERHQDDAFDLDADGFAAANAVTAAAASVSGEAAYDVITFTDGADMDSLAAGESFRMRVTRDADNGSDTMTGDAELLKVEVRET